MREFRFHGERPQWGASLVAKVEELIDIAIGEKGKNVVDFKMLQTILYILARHLRILEQMVEVRVHRKEKAEDEYIFLKEDKDVGEPEQKSKRKHSGDGKKDPTNSDSYLISDKSKDGDGVSREIIGDRNNKTEQKRSVKKCKPQEARDIHKEKIRSKTELQRESSQEADDESEESDGGARDKTEYEIIKSVKEHKAKKDKNQDEGNVQDPKEGLEDKSKDIVIGTIKDHEEIRGREEIEKNVQGDIEAQRKRSRDRVEDSLEHKKDVQRDKSKDMVSESVMHDKKKIIQNKKGESIQGDTERRGEKVKSRDDESLKPQKKYMGKDEAKEVTKEDGMTARDNEDEDKRGEKDEINMTDDNESKVTSDMVVKEVKITVESEEKATRGKSLGKEGVDRNNQKEKNEHSIIGDSDKGEEESPKKAELTKGKDKKSGEKKTQRKAATKHKVISKKDGGIDKHATSDYGEGGIVIGHREKEGDKSEKELRDSKEQQRELEKEISKEKDDGEIKNKQVGGHKVGSIEVVTQQQFRDLEGAVRELEARAAAPALHIPDNEQLLTDIAQGNASLSDVMEAMQLNARITAAERAIERLAQLISLLAASGELPAGVLTTFTELEAELANMAEKAQSIGITKSPKEHGRTSQGLAPLSTEPTLSTAEAEVSASVKHGIMGTVRRVASEAKEVREQMEGERKAQIYGVEKRQKTQGADEGRTLFVREEYEEISVKEKPLHALVSASTSMGPSMVSTRSIGTSSCVTAHELNEALHALRKDFLKNIGTIMARADAAAQATAAIAKDVASKLANAMTLNDRVSTLYSTVNDYSTQLLGFDSGVHSQMQFFQQQINQIKSELQEGLQELHSITNTAETTDVLELTEQYQVVADELNSTIHTHKMLLTNQDCFDSEIKNIKDCVEELQEQKADCDEVLDGLRDKADLSRLDELLAIEKFNNIYEELDLRMQMCFDKFRSQDAVWERVVQDFHDVISAKAEVSEMFTLKDEVKQQINELNRKAALLTRVLEEPKAAVLTRPLTIDELCAACTLVAKMQVSQTGTMEPPRLSTFRPRPIGADDVCYKDDGPSLPKLTSNEDKSQRPHFCKRCCGGSHTLLSSAVTRENAPPFAAGDMEPTRRYIGLGTDNKLYKMANSCQPCVECNVVEKIPGEIEDPRAGDQRNGPTGPTVVTGLEARRITIVADPDIKLMQGELARKRRSLESGRSFESGRSSDRESMPRMDGNIDIRRGYDDEVPRKLRDIVWSEGQRSHQRFSR